MAMIFTVTLMFFIFTVIEAGLKRDRFAVRESSAFDMNCNHGLENVTRIRWEYIASQETKREIIYDSQSNQKILKTGFEVTCQPHQTFISKCTLTLIYARKEDSGKYICYVGEERKVDSSLKPINEIELVIRGPVNRTMVVSLGDSVTLPCEHNIKNLTRARWSHVSLQGVITYQLYYMDWNEATNNNYKGLCESYQPSCNLKILQANKESAGIYICMVGESFEFEEKYGMDQMTYFIEIELVVGELFCNENMKKDLTLIGENDCHGIEADVLNLKCSFNYFGNINYNLLHLRWIQKHKFNSLEKKLNSSLINHEVKDETNKISIQTNLSVAYEMQNSIFQCVLDDTAVKPCQLNEFRTQYAKNTTQRSPSINSDELQNKICLANKSANVQCSYYWVHGTPGAMAENPHVLLPFENMRSLGIYTCFAKCEVGNHKECIIRATEFEIIRGSHKLGLIIGLIIGIIIVAVTFGGICFVLKKKKLLCRRKNRKEQIKTVEGEVQQEAKGLLGQHTSQKTDDKVDDDGGESSTLSHGKQQDKNRTNENEIIRLSPAPFNPFEVKKILHEKKTVHHEIKIYEAMDTDFGKVLMIDGAVWDAELSMFSYQKMMNVLPIKSHPNPRKVLVIGGGEVRIVKELVQHPKVEFITVCEVDEELLAMCRNYVPSLTSSLDDPKVKIHIGDGFEFLKSTKEEFDVIINHSSHCEGPSEYLFTKEYYEVVKSKLKEGGVTSSIVNREDISGSDVIESRVMNFCKELFPVVQYLYIPAFKHPSSLVRCLICSLNPETNFKRLFGKLNIEYGVGEASKRLKKELGDPLKELKKMMAKDLPFLDLGGLIKGRRKRRRKKNDDGIFKVSEGPSFPLKVKKILHEENSKHHNIVIYESTSAKHEKVVMVDGAVWEIEFDEFSYQRLVSTLPIKCHPNLKTVLVIGRVDIRTAKEFLEKPGVESITIYEIDEIFLELSRKYLSSSSSYLDDPRVKVIIGNGYEFLKEQKSAFDVIIIHSSSQRAAHLFGNEYYEVVKAALKEGGVACSIIYGEDPLEPKTIESTVMEFCKKHFSVVQYFNIPVYSHPSCLIRSLYCSLNPEIDFNKFFDKMNAQFRRAMRKKNKSGSSSSDDDDDSDGDDDDSDDDDDDDSDDSNGDKNDLRENTLLNPSSKDFLDNIRVGQTISDREKERSKKKGLRIITMEKGNYNPLVSRKKIHEETSKHHDIVIYESVNHGKVFTLDQAFWVTEYDEFYQKLMISILIISHPEPKNVLVIGGGDGVIVSKLLKHYKVESITVSEADQRILELCCEHFPSIASSLDDSRVKLINGDGNELLKTQKNAFDVIINRSTARYDHLFGNEYFEAVKTALKEGGVSSLLVQGEGTMKYDVMKSTAIGFSDELFAAVQYFYLPCFENPGSLIRCLMCSLNPKTDFKQIYSETKKELKK